MAWIFTRKRKAQRGRGKEVVYYVEYRVGKKKIAEKIGTSKTEARRRKAEVEMEMTRAKPDRVEEERYLYEYAGSYIRKKQAVHSKACWQADLFTLDRFIEFMPDIKLSNVTRKHCEKFFEKRLGEVSSDSANSDLRRLRTFFNYAIDDEALEVNPAAKIKYVASVKKIPRHLTATEVDRLLTVVERDFTYMAPVVYIGVYAGLRKSEMIHLKWEHVNFDQAYIHIAKGEDFAPKNRKERKVPLNATLRTFLEKLPRKSEYVCTNASGGRFDFNMLRTIKKLYEAAEIKGAKIHTLRHTFCSLLAQKGVSLYKISTWSGHSHTKITEWYAHLTDADDDINRM